MVEAIPHYLLMSEARATDESAGEWRFVLESADGEALLEVDADESEADQERLDLLAVVRGLEALDQPSRVTLVTGSAYVNHGFRYGLEEWRENDWLWERFGEMTPVKNADLWRRVDRALRFHRVDCRSWRFDRAHATPTPARPAAGAATMPTDEALASFRSDSTSAESSSNASDTAASTTTQNGAPPHAAHDRSAVPPPHFRRSVSEDDGEVRDSDESAVRVKSHRRPVSQLDAVARGEARGASREESRRSAPPVRERAVREYDDSVPQASPTSNPVSRLAAAPLATAGAWLSRCRQWLVETWQADDS